MKKKIKINQPAKKYESPEFSVETILLETGVASGSTKVVVPGGATKEFSPEITDWKDDVDSETITF